MSISEVSVWWLFTKMVLLVHYKFTFEPDFHANIWLCDLFAIDFAGFPDLALQITSAPGVRIEKYRMMMATCTIMGRLSSTKSPVITKRHQTHYDRENVTRQRYVPRLGAQCSTHTDAGSRF